MKNYIYTLFNKLSCRYGDVMAYPSDSFALARLQELIPDGKGGRGPIIDTNEFELCRVGTIDIESGILESYPPVRLIWSTPEVLPTSEAN